MIHAEERMACAIASMIADGPARHIAIGAASPIPAAACHLLQTRGQPIRLSMLHTRHGSPFTEGSRELFDLAGQGRIDVFFLGGGQIDGQANVNLIGTGDWPGAAARFPGSYGSAFMYLTVPRTILFRREHTRRTMVARVDIVSAPGVSEPGVFRRGHAAGLVTERGAFRFDAARARFRLDRMFASETEATIRDATGFDYDPPAGDTDAEPDANTIALLRGPVREAMLATYPAFCARVWPDAARGAAA